MNEKSAPLAPVKLKAWLSQSTAVLTSAGIPTARLDAELLLAHVIRKNRTWLIAHSDELLDDTQISALESLLTRRQNREPLAYLTGSKEFYGRSFIVTSNVLIPRPETETLIDVVKNLPLLGSPNIHDVGTGTGCIAITMALELPLASVSASDVSAAAVAVAHKNANLLKANVDIQIDYLITTYSTNKIFDVITANLPYVDKDWEVSPELNHEPSLALFAPDHGLGLIKKLIVQSTTCLTSNGYLVLEADPCQHQDITVYAKNHGFNLIENCDYIVVLQKI